MPDDINENLKNLKKVSTDSNKDLETEVDKLINNGLTHEEIMEEINKKVYFIE